MYSTASHFLCGYWDLNSSSHTCLASPLVNKPCHQPPESFFMKKLFIFCSCSWFSGTWVALEQEKDPCCNNPYENLQLARNSWPHSPNPLRCSFQCHQCTSCSSYVIVPVSAGHGHSPKLSQYSLLPTGCAKVTSLQQLALISFSCWGPITPHPSLALYSSRPSSHLTGDTVTPVATPAACYHLS